VILVETDVWIDFFAGVDPGAWNTACLSWLAIGSTSSPSKISRSCHPTR